MNLIKYLFFISLFILSFSFCKTQKGSNVAKDCSTLGTVKDFTGLDGCSIMFVTEKGEKLLPVNLSDLNFGLTDGQKIRFGYTVLEDMMNICMAQDKMIKIECLELYRENLPLKPDCVNANAIDDAAWLLKAVKENLAGEVVKYPFRTDGWAYLLEGEMFYLYDCQGTLICDSTSEKECLKLVESTEKSVVIWTKN